MKLLTIASCLCYVSPSFCESSGKSEDGGQFLKSIQNNTHNQFYYYNAKYSGQVPNGDIPAARIVYKRDGKDNEERRKERRLLIMPFNHYSDFWAFVADAPDPEIQVWLDAIEKYSYNSTRHCFINTEHSRLRAQTHFWLHAHLNQAQSQEHGDMRKTYIRHSGANMYSNYLKYECNSLTTPNDLRALKKLVEDKISQFMYAVNIEKYQNTWRILYNHSTTPTSSVPATDLRRIRRSGAATDSRWTPTSAMPIPATDLRRIPTPHTITSHTMPSADRIWSSTPSTPTPSTTSIPRTTPTPSTTSIPRTTPTPSTTSIPRTTPTPSTTSIPRTTPTPSTTSIPRTTSTPSPTPTSHITTSTISTKNQATYKTPISIMLCLLLLLSIPCWAFIQYKKSK